MEIKNKEMGKAQIAKIGLLIKKAADLDMDISGYGEMNVNKNSGNVYLWLEDYPFTLYIPPGESKIYADFSCPNCGYEFSEPAFRKLESYYKWIKKLEREDGCIMCKEK